MKYFLSWGAGINSTSLIAAHWLGLLDINITDLVIVFCDTGCETHETYQYIAATSEILRQRGYEIHILTPKQNPEFYRPHIRGHFLNEFLYQKKWILYPRFRLCTHEWKEVPMIRFMKKYTGQGAFYKRYCRHMLSIASDEQHRAIKIKKKFFKYPLIDLNIDRKRGVDLIKAAGLPEAHKTGCYLCPMVPQAPLYDYLTKHPEYIDEIERIEKAHHEKTKNFKRNFFGEQEVRDYYRTLHKKKRDIY